MNYTFFSPLHLFIWNVTGLINMLYLMYKSVFLCSFGIIPRRSKQSMNPKYEANNKTAPFIGCLCTCKMCSGVVIYELLDSSTLLIFTLWVTLPMLLTVIEMIYLILMNDSRLASACVIDGKSVAKAIREEVKSEIDEVVSSGRRPPHLSVVLVGADPASQVYVNNKIKATKHTGQETLRLLHSNYPCCISGCLGV